jgi:hypothetical protein
MRKSPKVVSITQAKRKQSSTATEVPVQVAGGVQILTCHRTGTQISFSLGPLLPPGEAPTRTQSRKDNLIVFPPRASNANHD